MNIIKIYRQLFFFVLLNHLLFANDFGKKLKVGSYLHKLIRTSIGDFKLENAIKIEDFEKIIQKKSE